MHDPNRGTGRTTRQMEGAPTNAIYIWPNIHIKFAERMARELGRGDLRIFSPGVLDGERLIETREPIILDHAVELTNKQWDRYKELTYWR